MIDEDKNFIILKSKIEISKNWALINIYLIDKDSQWESFTFQLLKQALPDTLYPAIAIKSVDVERAFSRYRDALTQKRTSLTNSNIKMFTMLYLNSHIDDPFE